MNAKSIYAILILVICNSALVLADDSTNLVVVTECDGFDDSKEAQKVYPAEIVSNLGSVGKLIRVQRIENTISIYRFPESEWKNISKPILLPPSCTASPKEFVKVTKWRADETLGFNDGPDAGGSFNISRSGAFTYSDYQGNAIDDPLPSSWKGHLYRRGNIFWARKAGQDWITLGYTYQLLFLKKGSLCFQGSGCLHTGENDYDLGIK